MTATKGKTEAERALALGAAIRKHRRERKLTLNQLAEQVPMSASNLSRIELGSQGPPPDEVIERIAQALAADPAELLRAAGRYPSGASFEETVLARLDAIGRDVREVKKAHVTVVNANRGYAEGRFDAIACIYADSVDHGLGHGLGARGGAVPQRCLERIA